MKKEVKQSVIILKELNNALSEITKAAKIAYSNFMDNPTQENRVIMNSVYAFLVIRASAFLDELTTQFEKFQKHRNRELRTAISHYKQLFKIYKVKSLRNFLAHNRKAVKRRKFKYITDSDLSKFNKMNSPAIFDSFSETASAIVTAIDNSKTNKSKSKSA